MRNKLLVLIALIVASHSFAQAQANNWAAAVSGLQKAQDLAKSGADTVAAILPDGMDRAASVGFLDQIATGTGNAVSALKMVPNDWSMGTSNRTLVRISGMAAMLTQAEGRGVHGAKSADDKAKVTAVFDELRNQLEAARSLCMQN